MENKIAVISQVICLHWGIDEQRLKFACSNTWPDDTGGAFQALGRS